MLAHLYLKLWVHHELFDFCSLWASGDCGCTTEPGSPSAAACTSAPAQMNAVRATWPYLTDRRKQRRHWRERAYLKCFSRNHARSLNNWERSTIIFASSWWLLRQKAPRVRVVAHASTRLPRHTRAAVIAWMIHVLSRLQLHEKTAWWCYPQMGGRGRGGGEGKKKISQKIWESFAPTGGKWVVLCAPKNGVTFNEKGENKYNVENLDSSKLSAATEDCRAWWMVKEGKQSSNRQRGINYSYFLCAWVCARAWHCNCLLKLF